MMTNLLALTTGSLGRLARGNESIPPRLWLSVRLRNDKLTEEKMKQRQNLFKKWSKSESDCVQKCRFVEWWDD